MAGVMLERLVKRFGATAAVDDVTLEIPDSMFAAILGPSGCGKTTLLRLVAGLERPSAGSVSIGGEDVTRLPPERRQLGMLFQNYALLPHMTVAENLRFPLRMQKVGSPAEQRERVAWAVDLVRLGGMEARYPRRLSGGQQQRVALARAVISRPRVLLLDEPLSNLDAQLRKDMQVELIELQRQLKLTTVFVTHDQDEALSLADMVVLMREGRIEQIGSPREIYGRPQTPFTAEFLGAANLLEVEVREEGGGWVAALAGGVDVPVEPPADGKPGARRLVLRQEDLALEKEPAGRDVALPARVATVVYQGALSRYIVEVAGRRVSVLAGKAGEFVEGDACHLCWRRGDAIVL